MSERNSPLIELKSSSGGIGLGTVIIVLGSYLSEYGLVGFAERVLRVSVYSPTRVVGLDTAYGFARLQWLLT